MINRFFVTCLILVLVGCVSSGFNIPYGQNHDLGAKAAPSPLTAQNDLNEDNTPGTDGTIQQAGLEFVPEPKANDSININTKTLNTQRSPYITQPTNQNYSGTPYSPYNKPSKTSKTLKVALLVPLSGEHAHLGQSLLQASQLALFNLNYNNLEIIPRDTEATPEGARKAAQSAVEAGAQLVMGPVFSSSVRAAQPILRRSQINMIAYTTDWSLADSNTFIMGFLPFAQVQRITEYAIDQGYNNIGILSPNSDYGNSVIAAFHSYSYRNHLPTPEVMRFPSDGSDVSSIVRDFTKYDERVSALDSYIQELEEQLKSSPNNSAVLNELKQLDEVDTYGDLPFDAILLPVGGDMARSIVNLLSLYDLGPEQVKRLGTGLWDDKGLNAEPGLDGAWFAAPSTESRQRYETQYYETYNQSPPRISSLAYDSTALAIVLARASNTGNYRSNAFNRNSIINPNGFLGIDGIFRFHSDGLIQRGLAIMEIRKPTAIIIDPAPLTFQRSGFKKSNY